MQFTNAHFLVKPFNHLSLISVIERFILRIRKNEGLLIKGKYNYPQTLPFGEILYFNADGNYINVFLAGKKYTIKLTVKRLLEQLDIRFVQIHKSYIINKDFIQRIDISTNEVLIGSVTLPIGRAFKKSFIGRVCI